MEQNKGTTIKDLGALMHWKFIVERNYSPKMSVFFDILLNTGLYVNDIRSLEWIEILDGRGNIVDHMNKKFSDEKLLINVKLGPELRSKLQRLREKNPMDRYVFQSGWTSRAGISPYSDTYCYQFLKKSAAEAGLAEKVGAYTLKRSLGYHLVMSGKWTLAQLTSYYVFPSLKYTAEYCELPFGDSFEIAVPSLTHNKGVPKPI